MPGPLVTLLTLFTVMLGGCASNRVSPDLGPRPVAYVALGASDAVGVGTRDPEREGWVYRFYGQLPVGSSLTNLGVSGSRLDQAIQQQLPVALAAQPNLATVWLAVNDFNARVPLERYAANLDYLLAALKPTGAKVLVGNLPDLAQLAIYQGIDPAQVRSQVSAWNAVIAVTTRRHDAVLVDLHSSWRELAEHPEYVSADGFHPSSDGYARLADLFREALEASGGLDMASGG
jgi:acyl-CoA thioesterase I